MSANTEDIAQMMSTSGMGTKIAMDAMSRKSTQMSSE